MKNIMKKQCKKIPSWVCKGLLSVALSGLTVVAHAQGAEVCTGTSYTIASTVNASSASTYQWLENGRVLTGAKAATYTVSNKQTAGIYTYIRQAKSADCNEWQSSNEFTLTVFACSFTAGTATGATATFTDARDGKQYKTVVMPDGRTWFAQNLNYTKDLTFNAYAREANGKMFTTMDDGAQAIGSYWCPGVRSSAYSGDQNTCNIYGALYTWETAMMVDGKYADETKTSSAWDESWVSPYYYPPSAPGTTSNADKNNARGGTTVKDGGRGICPLGWHIPTAREWAIMLDKVEGDGKGSVFMNTVYDNSTYRGGDVGVKLKAADTYSGEEPGDGSWLDLACAGSDETAFSVRPAGYRSPELAFLYRGTRVDLLSSCVRNQQWHVDIEFRSDECGTMLNPSRRWGGFSVRCLKD
jgi:uncharacterized protein (TIGR02145 family)